MTELRDRLAQALSDAYTIEQELGGGGMSRVFVARERALDRRVVVKVLPDEVAGAVSTQRFRREIALAASLHHPHIVPVLSAGEVDEVPFYTMPFVDGETLRHRLGRGPMPIGIVVRILREIASALQYAHARSIVHRDIKPDNVLLSGDIASVTDFGVAKAIGAATQGRTAETAITAYGVALGTPMYMAPEQIAADPDVDERADLYAFGCLAYEMLTGEPPFTGKAQELFAAHIATQAVPVQQRRPEVPASLAALVMRCLAKSPADRPRNAAEVIATLDGVNTGSLESRPTTFLRPIAYAAAALVLFAAVATLASGKILRGSRATAADPLHSVGVVTFANLSTASGSEYFSEGITEEITAALGKVPGLKVASQSASVGPSTTDVRAIARALGVDALLLGSMQQVGNRARITVRLVKADGYQIWADTYDREIKDVFAVQDDIARAIVGGLRITLTGQPSQTLVRNETADPEAHQLYLQGMYLWNRRSAPALHKAMAYFRQAIARDSTYAAPWSGLSLAYAVIITYEAVDVQAMSDTALAAGRRALALDSTSSDGMLGVAQAEFQTGNRAEGLHGFQQALALDSNNARVRHWYAEALASAGEMEEASRQIHRALALEPLNLTINTNVARIELEARHYKEAEAALDRTFELDSTFVAARSLRAVLYEDLGRYDEAIRERRRYVELSGNAKPFGGMVSLANSYARAGRPAQAESILAVVRSFMPRFPSTGPLAALYYNLGRKDEALATLAAAVARNDAQLVMSSRQKMYDALRSDPRGKPLFQKLEAVR